MAVGLLSGTAHADTEWNADRTIDSTQTIDGGVNVTADITLTIPTGVTLTVNGGIKVNGKTLTVSGDGTLNVTGTNGNGGDGFTGNMIVNGTTVQVTGGNGGSNPGKAVTGTITYSTGLTAQESDNNSSWTTLSSGSSSGKRYMKVGVQYIEYTVSTDITQVVSAEKTAVGFTIVSTDTTAFSDGGWYLVSGEVTISSRITVSGEVNLILYDGATLSADKGINVASGDTLNIYAQTGGTGTLKAKGSNLAAGIGGDYYSQSFGGNVTIHGGTITATDGKDGAGIGGGHQGNGSGGNVTISGRTVTTKGGDSGAGIGKGNNGSSDGTLTVGSDCVVYGGDNENSTSILTKDANNQVSNRKKYMKVFAVYTVSFDKNNASATGSMDVQIVEASSPDLTLQENSFDLAGYTFNGWNTSADGTGTGYADKATITLTANLTLYAQWTAISYTISYDLDGGTNNASNPTSYTMTSPDITLQAPTKTGYTFAKWTSGDVEVTKIATGSSGDITLKANWTLKNYKISYDLDGGTNNTANPTSYTMTSPDITLQAPTKTGYTFAKWTSGDTEITSIPQGSTGDMTLKANWTANTYTVKFNSNGGTGSMSDLTLTYDTEGTLSDNKFTRAGYTFNGWKDNENNKTYNGGASVKNLTAVNSAAITLYAQWKVNQYTLTFNTDGGSAISAITQDYGTAVTAPANPTKEGYTFNGWDKEIPSTMPAENLTFTAQWKENEKTPDTDPESDDKQATEESTDKTPESKTVNAEAVSTMSNEELKQTFENKTAITLTGNISNENLSSVIEKIASVTEVKTLDLSKIEGVTEVKLKETTAVEALSVAGNQTIKKVEVQNNTSLKALNVSQSKVETIDAQGCSELTEVILTSCDELQSINVSETPITKLDTSNCEKLSSINCSSCDISELNIDGCKKLADLNCANNSLSRLDVSGFSLNSLECEHQTVKGFINKKSVI